MSDDFKVQVSYKFGSYDEHMLNVRGDSATEVEALIKALDIQVLTDGGALLKGAVAATSVTVPTTPAPTTAPAPAAPPASGPVCIHGPRTRRNGTSSRGAWVGWFCKLPKNHPDQCQAEFEDNK
jgi:hypothetical protein